MGLRQRSVDETETNYEKPGNLSKKEAFSKFLYDRQTGSVCGRTPISWAKIIIFYVVFYTVLICFSLFCYFVFSITNIDPRIPKLKMEESCIGTNPGLGFRPTSTYHVQSTLIEFTSSMHSTYAAYKNELKSFLEPYRGKSTGTRGGNLRDCTNLTPDQLNDRTKACIFQLRKLDICSEENDYGFLKGQPCFFLKLNRIYNWVPEYYNNTAELPKEMPKALTDFIKTQSLSNLNQVWISCEGLSDPDKEYLKNTTFMTDPGIPHYYFPFTNVEGFLSPLVVFKVFEAKVGVVITVECKAWAKNIKHSRKDKSGLIQFELLIDKTRN